MCVYVACPELRDVGALHRRDERIHHCHRYVRIGDEFGDLQPPVTSASARRCGRASVGRHRGLKQRRAMLMRFERERPHGPAAQARQGGAFVAATDSSATSAPGLGSPLPHLHQDWACLPAFDTRRSRGCAYVHARLAGDALPSSRSRPMSVHSHGAVGHATCSDMPRHEATCDRRYVTCSNMQ